MRSSVTALLGPTNTGKTYLALERMLAHETGMIGFPLRLLARENYDRLVGALGREAVALVTGEERVVPPRPRYWVATVEAMPLDRAVDFLAVDEVQLAADRERGHVFTDRILHARGREETMLIGAETIRPLLRRLLPDAAFISRPRLSTLSHSAPKKIGRLPRRSALIVFSIPELYRLAERLRRE
jgi:ATP-dependent RNA helicase SUPV3L1/SUV3